MTQNVAANKAIIARWTQSAPEMRVALLAKLRTELKNWPDDGDTQECIRINNLLDATQSQLLDWQSLFDVDAIYLKVFNLPALLAKFHNVKDEYIDVAGKVRSSQYFSHLIDPPADLVNCDEKQLRTQAIEMLSEVHRLRMLRYSFMQMRLRLTITALLVLLFTSIIATLLSGIPHAQLGGSKLTALGALALAGILGGCISTVSRLFSLAWSAELAAGLDDMRQVFRSLLLNVLVSMLQGAVFALTIYTVFASGLVQGSMFPSFRPSNDSKVVDDILKYFEYGPQTHADFAKALIWSFAAGFSERIVPDFIKGLATNIKPSS